MKNQFKFIVKLFGLLLLVSFVLYPPNHHVFRLMNSVAIYLLPALGAVLLYTIFNKKWKHSVIYGLNLMIVLLYFGSELKGINYQNVNGQDLVLAHYNVLATNKDHDSTIDSIIKIDADLVSIQEVSSKWEKSLKEKLKSKYPYYWFIPQDGPGNHYFGIAVMSKYPILNKKEFNWGGVPNLTGDVQINKEKYHFVLAHTMPPMTSEYYDLRNNHLKQIAHHISSVSEEVIVMGDFNAVSWCPEVKGFVEETNLIDNRSGLKGTFPAWLPFMKIPIDHIFTSKSMTCSGFDIIKDTSSDHYGVTASFTMNRS